MTRLLAYLVFGVGTALLLVALAGIYFAGSSFADTLAALLGLLARN